LYQIPRKMNKLLQTLLYLVLFVTAASATTIKGHVYDHKTGEPLVGATVTLKGSDKGTSTGLDGSFQIKDVKAGSYTLFISYITYKSASLEINATKERDDYHNLKIYLEPAGKEMVRPSVRRVV